MRYLVTGGTGFIGRAVLRRLVRDGFDAAAYVRPGSSLPPDLSENVETVLGSLGDPNQIARAAKGRNVVIHAAAVRSDRAAKAALQWVNVAGTENVVNAAKHAQCERVVHISCADVTLLNGDRTNWNEDRELDRPPLGDHARSKQLAEEIALTTSGRDIEVTAIRPSWVWGPDDSSALADLATESGGIQLVGKGAALVGAVYIDNLVDAILLAGEVPLAAGQRYYISDGDFLDAREFFGALSEAIGLPKPRSGASLAVQLAKAKVQNRGLSPAEIAKRGRGSLFDTQNARADLCWEPEVDFKTGTEKLRAWAEEMGGATEIAKLARPPATAESVKEMIALADSK